MWWLAAPYAQLALAALVALVVSGAIVGVLVNLRGMEFVSDGLIHAVFPGVVIGTVTFGQDGLYPGALIAALLATILLTLASHRGLGTDATTAVLLTGAFAIGIVIVSRTTQFSIGLEHLLFGQLLTVQPADLAVIAALGALAVLLAGVTWKEQVFLAFDRRGAHAAGSRTLVFELVLNLAVALVVVAASRAVGNLLVLAVLIVPAAVGRLLSRRIGMILLIALATGLGASVLGLAVAFELSIGAGVQASPSSVVVLTLLGIYLVVAASAAVRARAVRGRRATPREAS